MTVESQLASDGHMTFRLGPVERWVIALGAALLVGGGWRIYSNFSDRMDIQAAGQQAMVTQMAVMNAQLATMNTQLADVPGLSARITKLETTQVELLRRQNADEQRWEQLNKSKGWAR